MSISAPMDLLIRPLPLPQVSRLRSKTLQDRHNRPSFLHSLRFKLSFPSAFSTTRIETYIRDATICVLVDSVL